MHEPKWRRTWRDEPGREDWSVADAHGHQIARVYREEDGPLAGRWRWFARTAHLPNQGTEESREAAQEAAKRRWLDDPLELGPPGRSR